MGNLLIDAVKFESSHYDRVDNVTSYYGFENKEDSTWYIRKSVVTATVTTYTYAVGKLGSDYLTNWNNRASLTYNRVSSAWQNANLIS